MDVDDDPFVALAQIRARRAMADVAGFPHHPSWDELEADAMSRLRRAPTDGEEPSVDPPHTEVADPLLAFAQIKAVRLAADSMGMDHDPAWDRTEADVTSQIHRAEDGNGV
jgi:hypothetical protein